MPLKIIHISDTHFGDPNPTYDIEKIKNLLIKEINKIEGERVLAISGDITFKGSQEGYDLASDFFKEIIAKCNIKRSNIIACPGNHDIIRDRPHFSNFDNFIYSLRRDNEISFNSHSSKILPIGNTAFVLINSAHHFEHTYGLIPQDALELLEKNKENLVNFETRIIITHHHLLGLQEKDTSTTRNSYTFLHLLDQLNFNYILHGHQHSKFDLPIGNSMMRISSARSLSYHDRGFNNGMNIINTENGDIKFLIISPDEVPGQLTIGTIK